MITLSPLQLKDYRVIKFSIEANRSFTLAKREASSDTVEVDFNIAATEEEKNFFIELHLNLNAKDADFQNHKYRVLLILQGLFSFTDNLPQDQVAPLIVNNGLAMIYSIARGVVGDATGIGMHGKCMIPTINLVEVVNKKIQELANVGKPVVRKLKARRKFEKG